MLTVNTSIMGPVSSRPVRTRADKVVSRNVVSDLDQTTVPVSTRIIRGEGSPVLVSSRGPRVFETSPNVP